MKQRNVGSLIWQSVCNVCVCVCVCDVIDERLAKIPRSSMCKYTGLSQKIRIL